MYGYKLEYVLDSLSLEQVLMFYDYGLDFEDLKANILINKLAELLVGKKSKKGKKKSENQKPDKAEFYRRYGKKIKRKKKKD